MLHCWLFIFQLMLVWHISTAEGVKCPHEEALFDNGCFYASNKRSNFAGAYDMCKSKGCFQPVITSNEMNDFLGGLLHTPDIDAYDIGLSLRNGILIWSNGSPLKQGDYINWAPGMQPSNATGELCTWMDPHEGKWHLGACAKLKSSYYFCECPPTDVTSTKAIISTTVGTTVSPTTKITTRLQPTTTVTTKLPTTKITTRPSTTVTTKIITQPTTTTKITTKSFPTTETTTKPSATAKITTKSHPTTNITTQPPPTIRITSQPPKTTISSGSTTTIAEGCVDRYPEPRLCLLYKMYNYCTTDRWYKSMMYWCAKTCNFCQCTDHVNPNYCRSNLSKCKDKLMQQNCARTCGYCACYDAYSDCEIWNGYCNIKGYKSILDVQCKKTCGACVPMN